MSAPTTVGLVRLAAAGFIVRTEMFDVLAGKLKFHCGNTFPISTGTEQSRAKSPVTVTVTFALVRHEITHRGSSTPLKHQKGRETPVPFRSISISSSFVHRRSAPGFCSFPAFPSRRKKGRRLEMPENPFASASAPDASAAVRRYAPPNQRNRLNRRKSGEQLDRSNSLTASDGEKNHTGSSRYVLNDHRDTGNNFLIEHPPSRLVSLEGCSSSEAYRLLNDRWAAAIHCCDDPNIDLSERPVMYSGSSASAWGQAKLPHQLMSPVGNPQMDFLAELQRAMHNTNVGF